MKTINVSKGTAGVTSPEITSIKAVCLGSTLAVCASDPVAKVSAITIPLLPVMKDINENKLRVGYLDVISGLKKMFQDIGTAGGNRQNLHIWLVGAARFMDEPKELSFGVQLYAMVKKTFLKNGIDIYAEHVGGTFDRSVVLEAGAEVLSVILPDGQEVKI